MKKVLIVDDMPEDRELLTDKVRLMGDTKVFAYASGAEGVAHLRKNSVDCVLLDHHLSGENGIEVLSEMRSQSLLLPVILMSGETDPELAEKAARTGANGYVSKTRLTTKALQKLINEAIQDGNENRQNASQIGMAKQVLLVEDNADDRNHIADMIEAANEGVTVTAVATGAEAMAAFIAKDLDCVILDYRLEVEDGLMILKEMKKIAPFRPVIMLTGQGNEEVAAQSIRVGASNYIVKQSLTETSLRTAIDNAISRAALEAKVAEQETERQQFLNILVHDLRAPLINLTSIGKMASSEAHASDPKKLKNLLEWQGDIASHANDLITALQAYALLDGNVAFGMVSLETVTTAAGNNLEALREERNAEVEIAELPAVMGHEGQLIQLIQNLLQNGLKYNESERPKVTITQEDDDGDGVHIVISDNGIGISEEYLETIFAPLKRLWGSDRYEGSGLGLAICQKIVERHGGRIWCTSTVGKGSQFHIRLPVKTP